jgi:glycerol kinase
MIVGIDVGTQSLKVVLVDEQFNLLGEASSQYPVTYPQPGWAEQHPSIWETVLEPTIMVTTNLIYARSAYNETKKERAPKSNY